MLERTVDTIYNLSWPAKMISLLLSFVAPLASLIHVIVFLLVVDALTSIYYQMKIAGSKAERGKRMSTAIKVIESSKLKKTIEKMFFYVLTIIVFYSFDLYVLHVKPISQDSINTFSITNLSAVLISLVELTSIASNVSKITDNPIFNRVVSLFSKKVEKKFDIEE
jgi:hypothetical protein